MNYLETGFNGAFRIAIFLIFAQVFYSSSTYAGYRIGILRHLSIDEAEKLSLDSHAERLIKQVAESRGHEIEFINPFKLTTSTSPRRKFDAVISRTEIDKFCDSDAYLRALDYFQDQGIPVINSSKATLNAQDKFRTLLLAKKMGVRVPRTFIVHSFREIESLLQQREIQFPFFVKNPYGGCGKSVYFAENHISLQEILSQYFRPNDPILVEERIDLETDEQGNVKDMRVWVVRDAATEKARYVGGAFRIASQRHYLTNVAAGGRISQMPFDPIVAQTAELALESIGGDVAGIDIGRDKQGNVYLIEVNISFFTSKTMKDLIGVNIWELVMDLAEQRIRLSRK